MSTPPTTAGIQAWLDEAPNRERSGDFRDARLDRLLAALRHLPAPPAPLTVAGTKGKGSTLRLIECALLAGGRSTVAFTSPHLRCLLERWRVDGRDADPAELAGLIPAVRAAEAASGAALSWFERSFALAVLLAARRPGCHLLVEVGLGGRLDCANALDARVLVLTQLSHDHRDVLGPTLLHIAREKLALARPGQDVVIAPQWLPGILAARRALRRDAHAIWAQEPLQPWPLGLPGAHQQQNAAAARAALRAWDPGLDDDAIARGFAAARLEGRCQLVACEGRRILVDGAHNGPSIAATIREAQRVLRPGWRLVLATAKDKEIDEILAAIPLGIPAHRCAYASPRSRLEADWPARALAWPWHANVRAALAAQPLDADVCISGSLYLAGEALDALGIQPTPAPTASGSPPATTASTAAP